MKTGTLIFLSFLVATVINVCPATYAPADMQSGLITASTTNNNQVKITTSNNVYNHVLNKALGRVPIVTLGLTMLEGTLPSQVVNVTQSTALTTSARISFNVILSSAPTSLLTVRFVFLATTNNDFQVGFANGNIVGGQTGELTANLNQAVTNSVVISFFSAFSFSSIESSAIGSNIAIVGRRTIDRTVRISIRCSRSATISLGFVVYSQDRANSNYIVTSGQGIQQSTNINPQSNLVNMELFIFGFSSLTLNSDSVSFQIKLKINSPLLQLFSSAAMSASYLFIQNIPRAYCTGCTDSTIYDGSGCVTGCLGNYVPVRISNLYGYCRQCNVFNLMVPNRNKTDCACADQTYAVNAELCRACHFSCATCYGPSNKECLTCDLMPSVGTNRFLVNSQCRCMQGYYDDVVAQTCLNCSSACLSCYGPSSQNCLTCDDTKGRIVVAGQCQCKIGYEEQGGNCVYTGKQTKDGSNIPVTAITCPLNSVLVGSTCVCNSNFIRINDVCQQCPPNSIKFNETQCRCQTNLVNISNRCLRCPTNYIISNNSCICPPNSRDVNGACTPCPSNTILNGNICQCNQRSILINGNCSPCPIFSSKISATTCRCNQNYYNSSGQCVQCPTGSVVIAGVCQCPSNTVDVNGTCQSCQANSVLVNGRCECDSRSINSSGRCQPCPALNVKRGNVCVCQPNTYNVSGVCRQCPQGLLKAANGSCVCPQNNVLEGGQCKPCATTYIVVNNQCRCPDNLVNWQGRCTLCPEGLVRVGDTCERQRDAVNPTNNVPPPAPTPQPEASVQPSPTPPRPPSSQQLPPNTILINGQISCIQQTFNVTGICRYCSNQTQRPAQGTCTCRPNFVRVNNFCRRLKQFERVQNGAIRCIEGYFYIGGLCQPCSGTFNQTTERCQCRDGFISVNGTCRRIGNCQPGSFSNGRSCACARGTSDSFGRCIDCGPRAIFNGRQCICIQPGLTYINNCSCRENSQIQNGNSCTCLDGFIERDGRCVACPPGSFWNGRNDCSCPSNSILTPNGCQRCQPFSSVQNGRCVCNSGYTQRGQECISNAPINCPAQTYLNTQFNNCQRCINLCELCDNGVECRRCRQGARLMNNNRACMQICGDGVKINTQCDDGNFNNGDGCSNECIIEPGWNCTGGGPNSKDTCTRIQAISTLKPFPIQIVNTLRYANIILQVLSISYIPPQLAANGCPLCTTILTTSFSQIQKPPVVSGIFRQPNTLAIVYNFNPNPAIRFNVAIGINSNFWQLYSQYDLRQPLTVTVDPNLLPSLI